MRSFRATVVSMPMLQRAIVLGMVIGGGAGAIIGLLVGLAAHPPTAAFAVIELGVPSTIVGAILGLIVGLVILTARRMRRPPVR